MNIDGFLARIHVTETCWHWTGGKIPQGYGLLRWNGGHILAHRLAYELWAGPIPDGLQLDHLCRNPPCVNPDHLEPVTLAENVRRGASDWNQATGGKCKRGHDVTDPTNVYTNPTDGTRKCRACMWINHAERVRKRRLASPYTKVRDRL